MALNEQHILFGVKSAGNIQRQSIVRSAAKLCGVLAYGNGVLIYHAVVAAVFFRKSGEVFKRAQIVSDGQRAGGLYPRKHDFFILIH